MLSFDFLLVAYNKKFQTSYSLLHYLKLGTFNSCAVGKCFAKASVFHDYVGRSTYECNFINQLHKHFSLNLIIQYFRTVMFSGLFIHPRQKTFLSIFHFLFLQLHWLLVEMVF